MFSIKKQWPESRALMWQKSTLSNFALHPSRNYSLLHSNALSHNREQYSRCSECSLLQVCIPPKLMTSLHNCAALCWWPSAISINFSSCSLSVTFLFGFPPTSPLSLCHFSWESFCFNISALPSLGCVLSPVRSIDFECVSNCWDSQTH